MEEKREAEALLTVHEVSSRLRVDDTTVRRWIKMGALDLPHQENNTRCPAEQQFIAHVDT